MTGARVFTPSNGLAAGLDDWRGIDSQTALRSADRFIASLAPKFLADIDGGLAVLEQARNRYRSAKGPRLFDLDSVYLRADALAGLSNLVQRPGLGKAAASLCQLIADDRGARPEAIAVHIEALLLIRKDDAVWRELAPGLERLVPALRTKGLDAAQREI